ncbi:hypothetical protein QWY14_04535 [Planococcus sp. N028]|uniref:Uncharacterized protein n=1 Tax=Planococcus shixiaomingii TaxID=3058393 RepID=A0ABT8MZZ9_9BACL|nr:MULTISPECIES: hypothetical protein [unclassified Planococcus (in: firmicutes)]MDN7241043.1 hypothetical protein [Planococcus sp. N028]WKA53297.1 hypothetical protein QWY21_11555 [Planococcus sp. N022]
MEAILYSIELLHRGKYESWDFSDERVRDAFFKKVKERFAGKEIKDRNNVEDMAIVQLSATNLQIKEKNEVSQVVPFEWYDYDVFGEMLAFINREYNKQNKSIS